MKILLLVSFLIVSVLGFSQINEDFSDDNFSTNPTWSTGNASDFVVNSGVLQSNHTIASSSFYISTPSQLTRDCIWEFFVNLKFSTSGSNFVDAYLIADQPDLLAQNTNGFFVRIGNTNDEISLYKKTSGVSVLLIDGVNATVKSSSNNLIKIKVTRDTSGLFSLERDLSGTGNSFFLEGTARDTSAIHATSFGFLIKQSTASFFKKHFFDNIVVKPIQHDTVPPRLLSVTVADSNQLTILFDEPLDSLSAATSSNYVVNQNVGFPVSAIPDSINPMLVRLIFSGSFVNGSLHTLQVNGVKDKRHNILLEAYLTFTYLRLSEPSFKDIRLTEIMADVNPIPTALPPKQYLELYNTSSKYINLNGFLFSDGVTISEITNDYILFPKHYVLITKFIDSLLFKGVPNNIGTSSFPVFNTSGDGVFIYDNKGNVLDSIRYTTSWYKNTIKDDGGWSLELINPLYPLGCNEQNNWSASVDSSGGTPGKQNSVYNSYSDTLPPNLVSVKVLDSLHLQLYFDEPIYIPLTIDPTNFSINNGIGKPEYVVANDYESNSLNVLLLNPLQNKTPYLLQVKGIGDCWGNNNPNEVAFSYYLPRPYDVVINELFPDPEPVIGLPKAEYIELYNRTSHPISMKNWTISIGSNDFLIPDAIIYPDSFMLMIDDASLGVFLAKGYSSSLLLLLPSFSTSELNATGEEIILKNEKGNLISAIKYDQDWYHDVSKESGGWSLEQIDPNKPCEGISNWTASIHVTGGTPGKRNSVHSQQPDQVAPHVSRISIKNKDSIIVHFNEPLDYTLLKSPHLFFINKQVGEPISVIPLDNTFNRFLLTLSGSLQKNTVYELSLSEKICDCAGNRLSIPTFSFAMPDTLLKGDVLINEVLFNPNTGCTDYLELYNNSSKILDLKDLWVGEGSVENDFISDTVRLTQEGYMIYPGEYVLLSADGNAVKNCYVTQHPEWFLDIPYLPSMNSLEDVVVVCNKTGIPIDKMAYTEKMHFALLNDFKGIALERIDVNRSAMDKTNWNSASASAGFGTPGDKNSQYMNTTGTSAISVVPELFSPDNDGYNDVVTFNYESNEPGLAGNLYIYNSEGQLVRYLVRNENLGIKGSYSWNGLSDKNEKAPIGIYIIYFETFGNNGKVEKHKTTCVLAGKL